MVLSEGGFGFGAAVLALVLTVLAPTVVKGDFRYCEWRVLFQVSV
jgi:hypothetical protein